MILSLDATVMRFLPTVCLERKNPSGNAEKAEQEIYHKSGKTGDAVWTFLWKLEAHHNMSFI